MGRYAGQKRRATTSKKFEMNTDKIKVIDFAKKYHRLEKEFYIVNIDGYYSSVSKLDYSLYYLNKTNIEKWIFDETKNRWNMEGECL